MRGGLCGLSAHGSMCQQWTRSSSSEQLGSYMVGPQPAMCPQLWLAEWQERVSYTQVLKLWCVRHIGKLTHLLSPPIYLRAKGRVKDLHIPTKPHSPKHPSSHAVYTALSRSDTPPTVRAAASCSHLACARAPLQCTGTVSA